MFPVPRMIRDLPHRIKPHIAAIAIAILSVLCTLNVSSQGLYWVGGSGDWHNPQNWSSELGGNGGAGVPNEQTAVVIDGSNGGVDIDISSNATCGDFTVIGSQSTSISAPGKATLNVNGQFIATGEVDLSGWDGSVANNATEGVYYPGAFDAKIAGSSTDAQRSSGGGCQFFTVQVETTSPSCNSLSDGSVTALEPTDGVGPYEYQWVGGPATQTWGNRPAGTYTIIIIDIGQMGRSCSQDVFLNEPAALAIFELNGTAPTCPETCNGQANPVIIGGNQPYDILWSSGETSVNATQLCEDFSITITDANNCVLDTNLTFDDAPQPFVIDADVQPVLCFGESSGSIDISASGGTDPLSFEWSGPAGFSSTDEDISGLVAGDYELTITDGNNCSTDSIFEVTEFPEITADFDVTDNSCAGSGDGEIDATIQGGLQPYTLDWSGPGGFTSTDEDITDLEEGTYTLEVLDDNGCLVSFSAEVNAPDSVLATAVVDSVSCFDGSDGAIDVTATGGTPPYTYSWTGPDGFTSSDEDLSGIPSGLYSLTITDAQNCNNPVDLEWEVGQPNDFSIDITTQPVTCLGDADGTIDVSISGATPPYMVEWTGPDGFSATGTSLSNLEGGTYMATLTDANDCDSLFNVEVDEPDELVLDASITDLLCAASVNGAIDLEISGGTAPYTVAWAGPDGFTSSDEDISNLSGGVYTAEVADDNNCMVTQDFEVQSPDSLQATFTVSDIACFGDSDGAIDAEITGGTQPYTISWSGPDGFTSSQEDISGLVAGTYLLEVTDANGCQLSDSSAVAQPDELVVDETINAVGCFGESTASIDLDVSGGVSPYTFAWTGPDGFVSSDEDIANLMAGDYEVTIEDANGCDSTLTYEVTEPNELTINAMVTGPQCPETADGIIDIEVNGGTPPYDISWTGPDGFTSDQTLLENLDEGTYQLDIEDANGCVFNGSYTLEYAVEIAIDATVMDASCGNLEDGEISVQASGGVEPYLFEWSGPDGFTGSGPSISDLAPGIYELDVTDSNGCTASDSITVDSPVAITIDGTVTDLECAGDADGEISIDVSGGQSPYSFEWSGPDGFTSTDEDITGLAGGNYSITVTDSEDCAEVETFEVIEPDSLDLDVLITPPACQQSDGSLEAMVSGGTVAADYTYTWLDDSDNVLGNSAVLNGIGTGIYVIEITDDNGCFISDQVEVTDEVVTVSDSITAVTCPGGSDGAIEIEILTGEPPYTLVWEGPGSFTSIEEDISDLEAGDYTLEITDDQGCTFIGVFTVPEPGSIEFNPTITEISCNSFDDGAITLSPTGGTPPYSIAWSGPDGFTETGTSVSNLAPGTYQIALLDDAGCQNVTTIELTEPDELAVDFMVSEPLCSGESTGEIEAVVSGGTSPYTYSWTGPDGFSSDQPLIDDLPVGLYELAVTDTNGCEILGSIELDSPDSLVVQTTVTEATCGQPDGSAEATVSGGVPPYDIEWFDDGGTSVGTGALLENVMAGVYTLNVVDQNGCSSEQIVPISDEGADLTADIVPTLCFNSTEGAIDLTVTGGTPDYSYEWTGPNGFASTDEDISDLEGGIYGVAVTDDASCIYTDTFEVTSPDSILIQATVTDVSCAGGDGQIDIDVSGGTPPYDFAWVGPLGFTSDQEDISDLDQGTYTVTVQDQNLCMNSLEVEVGQATPIEVSLTTGNLLCQGDSSGFIQAALTGGDGNYTIDWTGPNGFSSDQANIFDLIAGEYTLSVMDGTGCELDSTITLTEPEALSADISITQPSCNADDGEVTATATGGTEGSGYNYEWFDDMGNSLSTNATLSSIGIGTYELIIEDVNGCTFDTLIAISNDQPTVTAEVMNATCSDSNDGAIMVSADSDDPPLTFSWTGPNGFTSSEDTIQNLEPGIYSLTVEDAIGCQFVGTYEITAPEPLQATFDVESIGCDDEDTGTISAAVSGGVPPYQLNWTGPDGFTGTGDEITVSTEGDYELTITDDSSCVATQTVSITRNPGFEIDVSITDLTCYNDTSGAITVSFTDGVPPFDVAWSGPNSFMADSTTIDSLIAGEYFLEVSDDGGCFRDTTLTVAEPDSLEISLTTYTTPCAGDITGGSIDAEVSGGTEPYTYNWTGPGGFTSNQDSISQLDVGDYTLMLEDANGCTAMATDSVTEPEPLSLNVTAQSITCADAGDGEIIPEVEGGTEPYTFTWTGPDGFTSDEDTLTDLSAGTYNLTLTDNNGCQETASAEVTEPDPLNISLDEVLNTNCINDSTGSITVTVTGGSPEYTYSWTGPDGFTSDEEDIAGLPTGDYELTVTDTNDCEAILPVFVDFNFEVVAMAGPDTAWCLNDQPAQITGTGENADDFTWFSEDGMILSDTSVLEIDNPVGTYEFILQAAGQGCSGTDTILVEVLGLPEVDAGPNLEAFEDEVFTLGGMPTSPDADIYDWVPGELLDDSTAANPDGQVTGDTYFVVTATDANGCSNIDSVFVDFIPEITIPDGFTPNGDGVNDRWVIDNIERFPDSQVQVVNRWGDVLFEANGYTESKAWDGRYENSDVPIGTYYYVIELNDPRYPDPLSGPLTIYR